MKRTSAAAGLLFMLSCDALWAPFSREVMTEAGDAGTPDAAVVTTAPTLWSLTLRANGQPTVVGDRGLVAHRVSDGSGFRWVADSVDPQVTLNTVRSMHNRALWAGDDRGGVWARADISQADGAWQLGTALKSGRALRGIGENSFGGVLVVGDEGTLLRGTADSPASLVADLRTHNAFGALHAVTLIERGAVLEQWIGGDGALVAVAIGGASFWRDTSLSTVWKSTDSVRGLWAAGSTIWVVGRLGLVASLLATMPDVWTTRDIACGCDFRAVSGVKDNTGGPQVNLWMAGTRGQVWLARGDAATATFVNFEDRSPPPGICGTGLAFHAIEATDTGQVWVAGERGMVCRWTAGQWENLAVPSFP